MRIRRCLWNSKLGKRSSARSTLFLPRKALHEPSASSPAASRNAQKFTTDPHPATVFRPGLGEFKYTTGRLRGLSRNQHDIALKVYADEPLHATAWRRIWESVRKESRATRDASAKSVLNHVITGAIRPHADVRTVRDVHYQIFGHGDGSARSSSGRRERRHNKRPGWNLLLCLRRAPKDPVALGRPRIQLALESLNFEKRCTISSTRKPWKPQIGISIGGHLKPAFLAVYRCNASSTLEHLKTAQTFGQIFNELAAQAAASVDEGVAQDINAPLLSVRDAVLRWLPSSAVATYIDFNDVEVGIRDSLTGRRYVTNTALSPDGSERTATISTPQPDPAGGGEWDTQHSARDLWVGRALCVDFAEKEVKHGLSYKRLANLRYDMGSVASDLTPTPNQILTQFSEKLQSKALGGLSEIAKISADLSRRYPHVHGSITQQHQFSRGLLMSQDHPEGDSASVTLLMNAEEVQGDVKVSFPIDVEQPVPGILPSPLKLGIGIYARCKSKWPEENAAAVERTSLAGEISHLSAMSSVVVQRIRKEVIADSYPKLAQLMAEALFQVVRFHDEKLILSGVHLRLRNPLADDEEKMYHARVFEKPSNGSDVISTRFKSTEAVSTAAVPDNSLDIGTGTEVESLPTTSNDASEELEELHQSKVAGDADAPQQTPAQTRPPILIALGSNVGDRLACIEEACRALDAEPDIRIVQTSSLYETKAMYVEDQAPFLNGVCEIQTSLSPVELLDRTQAIEQGLGRVKTIDKGPRNIDLDILLHGDTVMKTERLTIPHPLMLERNFVLFPMRDLPQWRHMKHPKTGRSFTHYVDKLGRPDSPMFTSTSLGQGCQDLRTVNKRRRTSVMSILNVTPDSFSDGGDHATTDVDTLKETIRQHVADGATIIDVGGQSSRPNASDVSVEEEIRRVLPAIEAIKSLPEASGVAISVDTYRAAVAKAAVQAGAHIVNDISGGLLDPEMLPAVARLGCTYIMMHMRGTPATMMSEEHCHYPDGVLATVARELGDRVSAAQAAGIRRWRIILDPGIGFSKTTEQNLELLRNGAFSPRLARLPWLAGSSRKSFIGKITGVQEPRERVWGTAATVTAAVRAGAEMVRVHDVKEMVQVVRMAEAIYRVSREGRRSLWA